MDHVKIHLSVLDIGSSLTYNSFSIPFKIECLNDCMKKRVILHNAFFAKF